MIDGFHRLRHHAVIGSDNQHHDVGGLGAARPHGGKRLMARRIDEGDQAAPGLYLIGADMLGNASRFARHHVGLADGVEQRGLAMVDVTHDGHDRRPRFELLGRVGIARQAFDHVRIRHAFDLVAHFLGDDLGEIGIDHIVDRMHLALLHQIFNDVDGALGHAVGEFLNGDRFRNDHFAERLFGGHLEALGLLFQALGAAAESRDRPATFVVFVERIGNCQAAAALVGIGLGAGWSRHVDDAFNGASTSPTSRAADARARALVIVTHVTGGGRGGLRRQFFGGFLGFAAAILFGAMTGIILDLAFGGSLAILMVAYILLGAALDILFLALAVFGLAHPCASQGAITRFFLLGRQGTEHHARPRTSRC